MFSLGTDYENASDTGKHTMLLGLFSRVATSIELKVQFSLIKLIGADPVYGGAAVRWISFQQQIELIRTIIADKYGKESDESRFIGESLKAAKKVLDNRNNYLHSIHAHDSEDFSKSISLKRGKLDVQYVDSNIEQMHGDLIEAALTLQVLDQVLVQYGLLRSASHGKPEQASDPQNQTQNQTPEKHQNPPEASGE